MALLRGFIEVDIELILGYMGKRKRVSDLILLFLLYWVLDF